MKDKLYDNKGGSIFFNLLLVGLLFPLVIFLQDFINLANNNMGLWTLEIFNIGIISYSMFKNEIYRHKKIAIFILFLVTILNFIEFFIPSTKHENSENKNELTDKSAVDTVIIKYGVYLIPLLIIVNELRYIHRDYCWLKMKYLMDIKSLPSYKIFIYIGSFGLIFVFIFFSIFTFVPCKTFNNIDKKGDNYFYDNGDKLKLYLEYCSLKDYDENKKTLYLFYDNIKLISKEYSNKDENNMIEIFLLIPLLFIFYLVNEVSRIMMIRYSDPTNILIYRYFYFFVKNIIQIIINEGDEQYITYTKFILSEVENLIGMICGLIYIELLELKFCKLDYELKKNIDKRSTEDILKGLELNDRESEGVIKDLQQNE